MIFLMLQQWHNFATADSFCKCIMLGILATLERVLRTRALRGLGGYHSSCCCYWLLLLLLLYFVKWSCPKRHEEEIGYPDGKDQTCPKGTHLPPQSAGDSLTITSPPFLSILIFFPIQCQGIKKVEGKEWRRVEVRRTNKVVKVQLQTGEWKSLERAATSQSAGAGRQDRGERGLRYLPEALRPSVPDSGREAINDYQGSMDRLDF